MPRIFQLDRHVADLIAAGEVVERPASVVKELMENSIDAGAGHITVEIRGGGLTYIRVTDDGCGIAPDDVETAFLRHATSKLRDAKGLEAITTLGFRGEALAAIAAVSRVEMLTRETGAAEGTSLVVEGGAVRDRSAAGCPEGTTVIVRDLFYNTPARLKFMKSDRAEGAAVSAQVTGCALSHPEVSVRYVRDGNVEFHTPGDGRIDSCVYTLFGRQFTAGLLWASSSDDRVAVEGYVSAPACARGNRSFQFFFVNGRMVRSKTLQAALEQAYKNALGQGRFPSCVLYVSLRPGDVDVNVHPAKTEVKFVREREVFDCVYYAALSALEAESGAVQMRLPEAPSAGARSGALWQPEEKAAGGEPASPPVAAAPKALGGARTSFSAKDIVFPEKRTHSAVREDVWVPYRAARVDSPPGRAVDEALKAAAPAEGGEVRVIGEALGTYVLAEKGESLWLIDKHAAHERIHFDRLKDERQVTMSQLLVTPVVCELGREDALLLLENAGLFESVGFSVEPFGESAVAVRRIPADIDLGDVEATLCQMLESLRRGGRPGSDIRDEICHTVACKAAIKAGRRSEGGELEAIARKVLSGEIRYCPHGRPVAVELTKAALDRHFKRT